MKNPTIEHGRRRSLALSTLLTLLASGAFAQTSTPAPTTVRGSPLPAGGITNGLPLAFVENRGQWETPARFVARRGPLVTRAEPDALVIQLNQLDEQGAGQAFVARLTFEGVSDDVELVGQDRQCGLRNYFVGDRAQWRAGVPAFSSLLYRGLHEGIDLRLREHAGRLEYDLLLAPDADLERFVARCAGIAGLSIDEDGSLVMQTEAGPLRHSPPVTWHVLPDGERRPLACRYVLLGERRFGFALIERVAGLPVVIDPGLEWSTYLGGTGDDNCTTGAMASTGHMVLGGITNSSDFPQASGSLQGAWDGFVAVLDPSQSGPNQLKWSTYLGGSQADRVWELELDSAGNVFAVGSTRSGDFPTTAGAYDSSHNGGWDAFVGELAGSDGTLLYSTFFGGSNKDAGATIELQEPAVVTIGGTTLSADLPTLGACQPAKGGSVDYWFARMDLEQSGPAVLSYSTYLGGASNEGWEEVLPPSNAFAMDLALVPTGEFVVTGMTKSSDFPTTPDAYDSTLGAAQDVIVTFIDPSVSGPGGIVYSTLIGGAAGGEGGMAVDVDDDGVLTLGGFTYSGDFPTTAGAFNTIFLGTAGFNDAFVLRLDREQALPDQQLSYSSLFSGEGWESVMDLTRDADGNVVVVGFTGGGGLAGNSFPTTCGAWDGSFDEQDGFLLYLDPAGNRASDLLYSTFVGGSDQDAIMSVDIVSNGALSAVCAVQGISTDFPTVDPYQTHQGGADAMAFRLEINPRTYCVAEPNSAGLSGALICGTGSVVVADNDLTLSVTGLPTLRYGYFIMAPAADFVPNLGGGDGNLCLGTPQVRFAKDVLKSGIDGAVSFDPDLTNLPQGTVVSAGETWYFQYWYRDKNPDITHNTSNGLALTFH